MNKNAVQHFSDEQVEIGRKLKPTDIAKFLEDFRLMHEDNGASKLISIKIPERTLEVFKQRCSMQGARYQTQIQQLISDWLQVSENR